MKNLKLILIFLLAIGASQMIHAQKMELGKVTIAELQEKECPKDPSAAAAILFRKGETKIIYVEGEGFEMVNTVRTKIKIYKKEGYEWANQSVKYYLETNASRETVSFSDVATFNLVDGKTVKTKLKSDGEFDEKINRYWGRKKITLPAVKEGSIIEFEYVVRSPNFGTFNKWDFQETIPVNYSEFVTAIPEYFAYNLTSKGAIFPKRTVEVMLRSIIFNEKERSEGMVTSTSFSQSKIEYNETRSTYKCTDVPAMKEEKYVNNIDNYTASVMHELSSVKFPNRTVENYSTDWNAVAKKIYDSDDFGLELKKTGYFESDINTLIANQKTQPELVAAVFDYVKTNIKWNNFNGYLCSDGVKSAFKNKTGNVAEINLMLAAMLRYAGVNANPVLISTRENGIAYFPNRTAFNYVIVAIENPNGVTLLDATEKYSLPNVLPQRDLNWVGRLIRKDGTSDEIDLIPRMPSKQTIFMNAALKTDGSVEGKIRKQFSDHEALAFRQQNLLTAKDSYLEMLENQNNNIEVLEYNRENDLNLSKAIVEDFSFKSGKDVEIIDGKIYVSPMLFLRNTENPFKQEKREYPVDFGFPTQVKYNISIDLPEGYKIESLPAAANIVTGDEVAAFKYIIGNLGNKVQLTISSEMNAAILPADYYEVLKDYFQKIVDKENEKMVLVKS